MAYVCRYTYRKRGARLTSALRFPHRPTDVITASIPHVSSGVQHAAAVRPEPRRHPHQQRRVHDRGRDPRRAEQRDQELGLRRARTGAAERVGQADRNSGAHRLAGWLAAAVPASSSLLRAP